MGDCYCDDGWSGTNFDRPNFKRMIDDIELGRINIVIVKDLSRFGREYAQMGMYIEHYFKEKGVRFISIAENIDSKNGIDNLGLPFTNVMNSFYARQASSKTKGFFDKRREDVPEGEWIVTENTHEPLISQELWDTVHLTEIAQGEEVYKNVERFLPLIRKYTDITELNAHILNELIERIVVHEEQADKDSKSVHFILDIPLSAALLGHMLGKVDSQLGITV